MSTELSHSSPPQLPQVIRFFVDLACLLAFIGLGLVSHQTPFSRFFLASLPFVLALLASHCALWALLARRRIPILLEGLMVSLGTLGLGVALRLGLGDTAAPSFILVTALGLTFLLLIWRLIPFLASKKKKM